MPKGDALRVESGVQQHVLLPSLSCIVVLYLTCQICLLPNLKIYEALLCCIMPSES